ncbi:MAG: hypothetical protein IJ039_06775 [Clostridia bacterium]|nr:hypothetical protein [Clostridia bacterium]
MADTSFDDMLKKITDNPELMTKISQIAKSTDGQSLTDKLPSVISAISDSIKNDGENANASEKADTPPDKINDISDEKPSASFALPVARLQEKISKNSKLLIALKPYLSKERCDIVDSIIKMAQVADLMKLVK